nr:MAG TPA_asm: hypothetical protein [Caudoviricetes sp.]
MDDVPWRQRFDTLNHCLIKRGRYLFQRNYLAGQHDEVKNVYT